MSEDAPPSQGLVAGKYELIRIIGRGGMGSVWEGRHVSLGTHVAIKFIEKEYTNNDEARKRFDNEARAAATLQSKHAIQIFDHGVTDDGKPYIVMEMLIGEPLDKRIERVRILPLREAAHILQQVCRGLQKAHEAGIVHRDLKPENVFLVRNADDDDEVAKVLDFGIAKIRNADQTLTSSTRTGAVLGTPFYMSPEQARGLRDIDHRTDLWSIGVIAFKCTTGRLPFEGESLGDLLVKICTTPIPVPSQYNPQLPPSFDAWFSRALDRDPNRRFGTATELAEALAFAAGLSVRRPGSGPGSQYTPSAVSGQPQPSGPGQGQGQTALVTPNQYAQQQQYTPQYANTPSPYQQQYPGNVTSPPFVASASPASGGSRGLFVFAAIAGIIGLSLAGWGAKRIVDAKKEEPVTTTMATAPPPPPTTAIVTPLTVAATATITADTTATVKPPIGGTTRAPGGRTAPTTTTTAPGGLAGVTYTATPTVTATVPTATATVHPTATSTAKPGDFGAGF